MQTIYKPAGRAGEYAEYALNIYTGCPHGCTYCYAASMANRYNKPFAENVQPRNNIIKETAKYLQKSGMTGKLIHLCFSCDPYPCHVNHDATRNIIKLIKDSGNHVQILTKNPSEAVDDLDLLDKNDWFGVTFTGFNHYWNTKNEPLAENQQSRLSMLSYASKMGGVNTWVSCEPVFFPDDVYKVIKEYDDIDLFRIGKLNSHKSDINWTEFGKEAERLCIEHNRDYYIKTDLRAEMESGTLD